MTFCTRLIVAFLTGLPVLGCAQGEPRSENQAASAQPAVSKPAAVSPASPASVLERVLDRSQVCMVNDHFMGAPQIPVLVNGSTYYGCCPMCKDKLEQEAAARTAVDPVSHKDVDKATAVIGKNQSGSVVYFENEQNLRAYTQG